MRKQRVTQPGIVFGIFVMLFVGFALFLPGFSTPDNMIALLQNVAVLGILSLGMAIVIIGRGIDLSMIATLAVPAGLILQMVQNGHSVFAAFAAAAVLAVAFVLRRTRLGAYVSAIGDNPFGARTTGIPTRPVIVLQYLLAALIGAFAGLVLAASVNSMETRVYNSTLIYDVILVCVLGGI